MEASSPQGDQVQAEETLEQRLARIRATSDAKIPDSGRFEPDFKDKFLYKVDELDEIDPITYPSDRIRLAEILREARVCGFFEAGDKIKELLDKLASSEDNIHREEALRLLPNLAELWMNSAQRALNFGKNDLAIKFLDRHDATLGQAEELQKKIIQTS